MSSASLAVPRHTHAHPDAVRIAALSCAIALNFTALLVVMRPMAPQWIQQAQHLLPTEIRWVTLPPKVPDPPVLDVKPLPHPTPVPHALVPPQPATPPVAAPNDEGNMAAPPAAPSIEHADPGPAVNTAPVEATLAYRAVPLKYPATALRAHMQGTVLLRVLVDEKGVPQEATVEKSSGFALLDHSAREQVLQGWKFEPAMVGGQPVKAWARVPVQFDLNQF